MVCLLQKHPVLLSVLLSAFVDCSLEDVLIDIAGVNNFIFFPSALALKELVRVPVEEGEDIQRVFV